MNEYLEDIEYKVHGEDSSKKTSYANILKRFLKYFVSILIILILFFLYKKDFFSYSDIEKEPIVIYADNSLIREKPLNPKSLANADKAVYSNLSNERTKDSEEVVRLNVILEKPIDRGLVFKDLSFKNKSLVLKKNVSGTYSKNSRELSDIDELGAYKEASTKEVEKKITFKDILLRKDKNYFAKKSNSKSLKEGNYIQLGAFRSKEDVIKEWSNLKLKFKKYLASVEYITEKVNIKSKGVFYRLKVGSFQSESKARSVCNNLNKMNQRCFYVK